MSFPQGINFRSSSGYVTDISPATYEISSSANYPLTTPQGNNVGWTVAAGSHQVRNRNSGNDARLAGTHFVESSFSRYRIDLPASGSYRIRLAAGDANYAAPTNLEIYDNTTLLTTISATTSAAQRFLDATGVERTNTNWAANNAAITHTFASTTLYFKLIYNGTPPNLNHVYVEAAAVAPPFLKVEIRHV